MSELINTEAGRTDFRRNLFANASLIALLGYFGASHANAADEDRPSVWIELGGQAERVDGTRSLLAPAFFDNTPSADLAPLIDSQRPSRYSFGAEGKITFTPVRSDWIVSAAVRYGRSQNARHLNHHTPPPYVYQYFGTQIFNQPPDQQFGDGQTQFKESHLILDFQAGKDVGLGLFGMRGSAVISAGIRFAQFTSSSNAALHARPEYRFGAVHSGTRSLYRSTPTPTYIHVGYRSFDIFRHTYAASLHTIRSTRAIGPSVSWAASLPVGGSEDGASFVLDWGVNGAVLFGRQRTRVNHQTTGHFYSKTGGRFKYHYTPDGDYHRGNSIRYASYARGPFNRTASRMVTIPNVGGFAAISLKFPNAKLSLGYRADFFFNASDIGVDARHETGQNYFGPYATISLGLGG